MSEGISPQNYISFFKATFRESKGFLNLFVEDKTSGKKTNRYFKYPGNLDQVPEFIEKHKLTSNIWFCAQLLDIPNRRKENISKCVTVWADLDDCHPQNVLIEPTITIQSSPNRWQAIWVIEKEIEAYKAEEYSRRIAHYHKNMGADTSGWDLTQLLRVPFTHNFKYDERPMVKLRKVKSQRVLIKQFEEYPELITNIRLETPIPDVSDINAKSLVMNTRNPVIIDLFTTSPDEDWSTSLWNLERALFENGSSREEVFAIVQKAACNKYERDQRDLKHLWHEVLRAENADREADIEVNVWDTEILTDKERKEIESSPSIIEEYVEWGRKVTDAPKAFHEGCAFMILSSLLCGSISLRTSFGTIYTNLWLMLLANSTLARKTTCMGMAIDLIEEIDSDIVLANEGSIEGVLSGLQTRPKRPSLFHRDEISGFLETIIKKDYLSGMLEWITQLYDGNRVKRVLKKEQILVRDPRFLFLGGGHMSRVDELLGFQHVTSGFIPRFIIIRAEADLTKYRPLGPPITKTVEGRDRLKRKLQLLHGFYNRSTSMSLEETIVTENQQFYAELTEDAWLLYAEYEVRFIKASQQTDLEGIYSPLLQRLCITGLKMAVLLASTRMEDELVVKEKDIKHAFYYVEKWVRHSLDLVENMGKTVSERTIETCWMFIQKHPDGVHRSSIYRRFNLLDTTGRSVIETLKQRGLIVVKGARVTPVFTTQKVKRRKL